MDIITLVEKYVKERIEEYKNNSEDHYDYWQEHIKYVYDNSLMLAKEYKADKEIVALGALLHDIALINKIGDRKEHHLNGEKIAIEVLKGFNYDEDKINKVAKCVHNHRSSLNAESVEEICVADADVLAHFDNIPMLFYSAYVNKKVNINEIKEYMKKAFEKDYNDLSDKTKKSFSKKYKEICDIVLKD